MLVNNLYINCIPSRTLCKWFVVIAILLAIIVPIVLLKRAEPGLINFISEQHWNQFAGATSTTKGLLVQPLGRVIVHQDGSEGQQNPPVNLTGPHLFVSGDFAIHARMEKIDDRGTLRLYGKPPVIYDQWRFENGSIAIDVATSMIVVHIWDGSSSNPIDMRTYRVALKNVMDISIEHRGDMFVISANKTVLGDIPDHHIFDSKEVWFGLDGALNDDWVLSALTVNGAISSSTVFDNANKDNPNTLRNLASMRPHTLLIGAAVAYSPLVTDNEYRNIALSEFSIITPENGMKPQFIHPQKDVYTFTEMDTLVDIALKNKILVHGHTLVYAKSSPEWMMQASIKDRENIMIDHITTVANHFKDKVAEWDVVNEPLSNKKSAYHDGRRGLDENIWYEAMGETYIDIALNTAHKADPHAKLYINDYGLERDGERWDAMIGLVKRLKSRDVPLDGIGFESHIYGDGDYSNPVVLRAHMQTLASLGLKVRISEIDVTGDDPKEQINQYQIALDACLRAPNCTGYSIWGITDLYGSTTRSDRYPAVYGTSLLWDKDLKVKPAYTALQKRLRIQ